MKKLDSINLYISLIEARSNHLNKMVIIAATGWLYECLQSSTEDEQINIALEKLKSNLKESHITIDSYFSGNLLISVIAELELYIVDIIKCILKYYPRKIKNMKFDLSDVLDKTGDEIIQAASERFINELMYKKPLEYLESFCNIVSIDSKKIKVHWGDFVEAKAKRDLGVHNNWIVNEIYIRKLSEVGLTSKYNLGQSAYPDSKYLMSLYDNCSSLIEKINEELENKFKPKDVQAQPETSPESQGEATSKY